MGKASRIAVWARLSTQEESFREAERVIAELQDGLTARALSQLEKA